MNYTMTAEITFAEGRRLAERFPVARSSETARGAQTKGPVRPWSCTRPEGHAGPHAAHLRLYDGTLGVATIWY